MTALALSVVIPCYNEAENLVLLFERLRRAVGERSDVEVILVDNGSTDDTAQRLHDILEQGHAPFARVVRVAVNHGYGFGILSGLRAARGEFLAWTHADLQTDPADVVRAFDVVQSLPDNSRVFLKGRRVSRPMFDALFTNGMSIIASVALRTRLSDVNAQPKLFHRSFLSTLGDAPHDFSLDLYAIWQARRAGYRIVTVDVEFAARQFGEAKGGASLRGKFRLTRRTLAYIRRLAVRKNGAAR